ncbi:unnamed protein product, partial [Prorocentrum cordatum]
YGQTSSSRAISAEDGSRGHVAAGRRDAARQWMQPPSGDATRPVPALRGGCGDLHAVRGRADAGGVPAGHAAGAPPSCGLGGGAGARGIGPVDGARGGGRRHGARGARSAR